MVSKISADFCFACVLFLPVNLLSSSTHFFGQFQTLSGKKNGCYSEAVSLWLSVAELVSDIFWLHNGKMLVDAAVVGNILKQW